MEDAVRRKSQNQPSFRYCKIAGLEYRKAGRCGDPPFTEDSPTFSFFWSRLKIPPAKPTMQYVPASGLHHFYCRFKCQKYNTACTKVMFAIWLSASDT